MSKCLCGAKGLYKSWVKIHLVDKCLLVILALLMIQSTLGLFFGGASDPSIANIDVMVRTSAAGIFGYLISANFSQRHKRQVGSGQSPAPLAAVPADGVGPVAQIGFQAEGGLETVRPPRAVEDQSGKRGCDRAQILVVGAVGVVSLVILLLYRNLGTGGVSDVAALAQLRDFVSGSVGFLISFSTGGTERA